MSNAANLAELAQAITVSTYGSSTPGASLNLPLIRGTTNGITAGTTQTLAGSVALTTDVNVVSTVATAGNGVALPAAPSSGSYELKLINTGANAMAVWAQAGATIDFNTTLTPTAMSGSGTNITVTWSGSQVYPVGGFMNIAGVTTTTAYNGLWQISSSSAGTVTLTSSVTGTATLTGATVQNIFTIPPQTKISLFSTSSTQWYTLNATYG